jgi:hypothetical protein
MGRKLLWFFGIWAASVIVVVAGTEALHWLIGL